MASDLRQYRTAEVLNKVLNTSNDSLKVDIVAGAEYAEDSSHTDADTGNFILGVRNDTLAALGGTDGDYVPFQMNSSGALFIDIADGGQLDTIIDTLETTLTAIETDQAAIEVLLTTIDADTGAIKTAIEILDDWDDSNYANVNANIAGTDIVGGAGSVASGVQRVTLASDDPAVVDLAAIEVLLTAANVDHAANEVLLGTIDADTNAIKVDMAAIEVLLTAANVDHAANEALLITIDEDTNAIKGHVDGIETLITSTNSKIDTFDAVLDAIKVDTEAIETALEILDDWDDSNYANVNANIAGTDIVGGAGAVASGVQRMTLASDDPAVANLNEMLYGTALAVTAVHGGSDHTLGATYQAFFIGVGGDVSLDMATSGTNIVFKNLASGQMLPVQATVVNATNTTATNIVALKA